MTLPGEREPVSAERRVAIIGMSCLFPGAPDLATYWSNIVGGIDCIRDPSESEWDAGRYAGRDPAQFGGIYCPRGGFISEFADFDPLQYGIMPSSIRGGDPEQFLSLRVASETLRDAGYHSRPFNGDRAEILLGRTSIPGIGSVNLIQHGHTIDQVLGILADLHPEYGARDLEAIESRLRESLRPCTTDSIPAVMPNVQAGRIANRLGFRGRNLLLDAACATSLIAVETGVMDLLSGQCDMVLAGGIHVTSTACFYQMFSALGALSRRGQARPFDRGADGTILGEGIGMVLLKRLEDAVRDGDRIYAVILGVGSSSDGKGGSALAPSAEGEALAMRRAYEMAGISPQTVELLEAHGTATAAGDTAEMQAVQAVFGSVARAGSGDGLPHQWCAVGSVKSMIGHCQASSGVAGLIKAALAVYHKVLPPTINVSEPNPAINWSESPCFINTQTRPWIHPEYGQHKTHPRRAAVSAFGFGGVNAHTVIEEYPVAAELEQPTLLRRRDSEVCLFAGETPAALLDQVEQAVSFAKRRTSIELADIAYTLSLAAAGSARSNKAATNYRLAVVASSREDLLGKLESAREHLSARPGDGIAQSQSLQSGLYYTGIPAAEDKIAFVLPGLGAAYPNMLQDLSIHFPEVRAVFDFVDLLVREHGDPLLPSRQIFPLPPGFANWPASNTVSLALMDSAVVVVLLAEWALFVLLKELSINPDAVMGCSTGEFAALTISGASDIVAAAETFYRLSIEVARSVPAERLKELRSLRLKCSYEKLAPIIEKLTSPVYLSAEMTDRDSIVSGTKSAIEEAAAAFKAAGIDFFQLPAAIPYHTPLVSGVVNAGREEVRKLTVTAPEIPAWSCSLSGPYPHDSQELFRVTTDLFEKPILFRTTLEAMYEDGIRTFVEVGPKGSLTPVISDVLQDRPHLAVAANLATRSGVAQINHLVSALFCRGVSLDPAALFKRRDLKALDLSEQTEPSKPGRPALRLSMTFPELKLDNVQNLQLPGPNLRPNLREDCEFPPEGGAEHDGHYAPAPASEEDETVLSDGPSEVLGSYLDALTSFHKQLMNVQQQVMTSYFHNAPAEIEPEQVEPADTSAPAESERGEDRSAQPDCAGPFLAGAEIRKTGTAVTARRRLNIDTDLYLLDHAIGATIASEAGVPDKVYLLPLMVALEIMAETAALLVPELVPIKLENVWAYRRIRVDQAGFPLVVSARTSAEGRVLVEMRREDNVIEAESGMDSSPLMSCEIEFAPAYPGAPSPAPALAAGAGTARLQPKDLYGPATMFHGPRMRCVRQIDGVTEKAIAGTVQVKGIESWFPPAFIGRPAGRLLLDPNLLDNASQLVLFFLFEKELPVTALLPFHIECVQFFGPPNPPGETVAVCARLVSVTDTGTRAHVEIGSPEGAVWAQITGISSRRISLSSQWIDFIHAASRVALTERVDCAGSIADEVVLVRVDESLLPEDEVTLDWLTDYILSPSEREYWLKEMRGEKRKREWLLGRIAGKDAVRRLVRTQSGHDLAPADIELTGPRGEPPAAGGAWSQKLGWVPVLSISHTQGTAVALAARQSQDCRAGVDIEFVRSRDEGFETMLLSDNELRNLEAALRDERELSLTRIWCAKEAAGKACGIGLGGNPHKLVVEHLDQQSGHVRVRVPGSPAAAGRSGEERLVLVRTFVDNNLVTAVTVGEAPTRV